jgi:hypothetical protein
MSTRATCVLTVVSDTISSAAISAFDIPRAIRRSEQEVDEQRVERLHARV